MIPQDREKCKGELTLARRGLLWYDGAGGNCRRNLIGRVRPMIRLPLCIVPAPRKV